MKTNAKTKLKLNKETLRTLTSTELGQVAGGIVIVLHPYPTTSACNPSLASLA